MFILLHILFSYICISTFISTGGALLQLKVPSQPMNWLHDSTSHYPVESSMFWSSVLYRSGMLPTMGYQSQICMSCGRTSLDNKRESHPFSAHFIVPLFMWSLSHWEADQETSHPLSLSNLGYLPQTAGLRGGSAFPPLLLPNNDFNNDFCFLRFSFLFGVPKPDK